MSVSGPKHNVPGGKSALLSFNNTAKSVTETFRAVSCVSPTRSVATETSPNERTTALGREGGVRRNAQPRTVAVMWVLSLGITDSNAYPNINTERLELLVKAYPSRSLSKGCKVRNPSFI